MPYSAFQSAGPVFGEAFVGRDDELSTLIGAVSDLKQGIRRRYCILGPRKIGKTSLLEELSRRLTADPDLIVCRVDLHEASTPDLFFVRLSLELLDAFVRSHQG